MKCWHCEESPRASCAFCGRFVCKDHASTMSTFITMFVGANKAFLVEIKDISKGGCQITRPRAWPFNLQDEGRVYIFGEPGPVSSYPAHIAWYREEFVGIEFD